jgi:phage-related protein
MHKFISSPNSKPNSIYSKKPLDNISKKEYLIEGDKLMFNVQFYTLPNGEKPVEKFLDSLDLKMRVKALGSIEILAEFGNTLREPYSKAIGKGLFELRIKFAGDITRIFYFFVVDNKIILTNGFVKKTRKTPSNEIELAMKYKVDYEGRQKK